MRDARAWIAGWLLLAACTGGGGSDEGGGSTTASEDPTSGAPNTTIPLPPLDGTTSDGGESTTTAATDDGTTSGTGTSGSTGPADSSSSSSSSSGEPAESSDGGPTTYDVEWCILQYPPAVEVAVGEAFAIYVRLYAPGLTEQTGVTDPAPELVVEVGYSVDGSDPSTGMGAPWTWEQATPNAGYGPGAPDYSANNDEYQHELAIPMAGIFDYAARISGDSGTTWVYCDVDGLAVGGYTPDQAGDAQVGQ